MLKGYRHTEEAKQKMSENHNHVGFSGRRHSLESRQKMSESLMGRKLSLEHRRKMMGNRNAKGYKHTLEARRNISKGLLEYFRNGGFLSPHVGRSKSYYREDLGHFVRSSWEANYARFLICQGYGYEYEKHRFSLSYTTYIPDFYIPRLDVYIEVKAEFYDTPKSKLKRALAVHKYGIKINMMRDKQYYEMMESAILFNGYLGLEFE